MEGRLPLPRAEPEHWSDRGVRARFRRAESAA